MSVTNWLIERLFGSEALESWAVSGGQTAIRGAGTVGAVIADIAISTLAGIALGCAAETGAPEIDTSGSRMGGGLIW